MPSVARTSPETLSIGELSRRTGVNIETIRYYERVKILLAPPRTSSDRLRVIDRANSRLNVCGTGREMRSPRPPLMSLLLGWYTYLFHGHRLSEQSCGVPVGAP